MSAKSLVPGVHRVNVGGVAAFILERDDLTIIDTGLPGNVDVLLDAVSAIGRDASDVKRILVTHYHQDHIGNLLALAEKTGARVYAPEGDADLIRKGGRAPEMQKRGALGAGMSKMIKASEFPPHEVHQVVSDGDKLNEIGGLEVVGTPGHTPGHVCFLLPEQGGILFVGDAAFNLLGRLAPPPIAEDFETTDKSFAALGQRDFEVACFAHGPSIKSGASKKWAKAASKLG